ncbi:DUF298-domain-containing protein [Lojkania enalia]|uniref:Defective in cullin neddylation protein n=1 Tax=Lojkania enalia TaxID=147567 RepID=A0A9P4K8Y4_9PLEO|nr:DUF298-domain-containing protein [Didymosphaeria enalia]
MRQSYPSCLSVFAAPTAHRRQQPYSARHFHSVSSCTTSPVPFASPTSGSLSFLAGRLAHLDLRKPHTDSNMPPGYTSQQKSAISQFMSFTQSDRNTAIRFLKGAGWNQEAAVNGFFSGGGGSTVSSSAKSNLNKIFDKYREDPANSPDSFGVEGSMKYLEAIGIDIEGLDCLATLEIIQAPGMGEMTREGFVEGWSAVNADTIDKQKAYMNNLKQTLPSSKDAFTKIYKYTFQLAKAGNSKAITLDVATAYWELLFTSPLSTVKWKSASSPWIDWWIEFLNTSWKKSVNKDMWNETLKFAQMTLEDEAISFWNEESSWPSVIDEFVDFVKGKRGDQTGEEMEE